MTKIIKFLRVVEVALLKFFISIGKKTALGYNKTKNFLAPKIKANSRTIIYAVLILYVVGAVVFGVRLYSQDRHENIDLYASYIYPFPVAKSGQGLVFNNQLQRWIFSSKLFAEKNNVDAPEDLATRIAEELNDYQMISQEADRLGVRLSKAEIEEKFNLSIEGIGTAEQARDFIKQNYGISLEQFQAMIQPAILLEKVREEKFARVRARHILINDEGQAKEVLQQIKDGGNFEEIAKERSEDQGSRDDGGLLAGGGFFYKGEGLVVEFEEALFKLGEGEVSELVKTEFGYHIIKVEEREGEIDKSFEEWINELKEKYPQKILV